MTAVGWDTLGAPMGGQAGYWHGRAIEAERRLAALTEQKAPVEVEGLVERLRRAVPVLRSWGMNSTAPLVDEAATALQSQATELATLKQQLAESTPSPDTEGVRLAKEFARHCANADEQVGHGNMARLRMEFDTFVWDKRHAIAALLRTAQNTGRDEVLEAFAGHRNWELSYEYGEEEPGAWQVHSVNGGINDRQWTFIGSGETPSEAITAALSSPPVSTVDEEGGGA